MEGSGEPQAAFLTAAEVGRLLAVSPKTIYRWAAQGDIPSYRLPGRTVRFKRSEIESWVDALQALSPVARLFFPSTPRRTAVQPQPDGPRRGRPRRVMPMRQG